MSLNEIVTQLEFATLTTALVFLCRVAATDRRAAERLLMTLAVLGVTSISFTDYRSSQHGDRVVRLAVELEEMVRDEPRTYDEMREASAADESLFIEALTLAVDRRMVGFRFSSLRTDAGRLAKVRLFVSGAGSNP